MSIFTTISILSSLYGLVGITIFSFFIFKIFKIKIIIIFFKIWLDFALITFITNIILITNPVQNYSTVLIANLIIYFLLFRYLTDRSYGNYILRKAKKIQFIEENKNNNQESTEKEKELVENENIIKSKNFCPNCGEKLNSGIKFCPNCGEKIVEIIENGDGKKEEKTKEIKLTYWQKIKTADTKTMIITFIVLFFLTATGNPIFALIMFVFNCYLVFLGIRKLWRLIFNKNSKNNEIASKIYYESKNPNIKVWRIYTIFITFILIFGNGDNLSKLGTQNMFDSDFLAINSTKSIITDSQKVGNLDSGIFDTNGDSRFDTYKFDINGDEKTDLTYSIIDDKIDEDSMTIINYDGEKIIIIILMIIVFIWIMYKDGKLRLDNKKQIIASAIILIFGINIFGTNLIYRNDNIVYASIQEVADSIGGGTISTNGPKPGSASSSEINPDVLDNDNDGIRNGYDNCKYIKNNNQLDSNNNGVGDACEKTIIPKKTTQPKKSTKPAQPKKPVSKPQNPISKKPVIFISYDPKTFNLKNLNNSDLNNVLVNIGGGKTPDDSGKKMLFDLNLFLNQVKNGLDGQNLIIGVLGVDSDGITKQLNGLTDDYNLLKNQTKTLNENLKSLKNSSINLGEDINSQMLLTQNADDLEKASTEKLRQLSGKVEKYEQLAGKGLPIRGEIQDLQNDMRNLSQESRQQYLNKINSQSQEDIIRNAINETENNISKTADNLAGSEGELIKAEEKMRSTSKLQKTLAAVDLAGKALGAYNDYNEFNKTFNGDIKKTMMATTVTSTLGNVLSSNPVDLVMGGIGGGLKLIGAEDAGNFASRFTAGEILKDTLRNSLDDDEDSIGGAVDIKKDEFNNAQGVVGKTLAGADLAITGTYAVGVYTTRKTLGIVDSGISAIGSSAKSLFSYIR